MKGGYGETNEPPPPDPIEPTMDGSRGREEPRNLSTAALRGRGERVRAGNPNSDPTTHHTAPREKAAGARLGP